MSTVKRYYDERAGTYDSEQELLYFKIYDLITWKYTKPYIPKGRAAKVLDAAGGTGKWSIPIAREGPKVVLVDLSEGMLKVARQKINDAGLSGRIGARQANIESLDFEDGVFDMVFCDHALCFAANIEDAVSEMIRVLKRNSPIVISAQNRYPLALSIFKDNLEAGTRILHGEEPFLMRGRIPVHTLLPEDFRTLLENNDVKIVKLIGKGIVMSPLVLPMESFWTSKYDEELLRKVMNVELSLCERRDALPLAGHIQAIAHKS